MMRGYGDRKRTYDEVAHLFNDTYPNRNPITKTAVWRIVKLFEEVGSIKNRPKTGRPKTATNDEKSLDVMQSFVENPFTSIRKTALEHDVSVGSVCNIIKKYNFHPYKVSLLQELSEDDYDRRIEFCETIMQKVDAVPDFTSKIVFSDEATFMLNGTVNRHNCRYWSDTNPRWMREHRTQRPLKVNVWAGIIGTTVIGPFFIDGNLNGPKYLDLLRNQIIPAIRNAVGNNFNDTWFQQDGASPHFSVDVRNYLNEVFQDRWIGRRGTIEWPARSPDLSPLDFFFWGHLKNIIYKTKPDNLDELRNRILLTAHQITNQQLRNSISAFYNRLGYCQIEEGRQFEHLIK